MSLTHEEWTHGAVDKTNVFVDVKRLLFNSVNESNSLCLGLILNENNVYFPQTLKTCTIAFCNIIGVEKMLFVLTFQLPKEYT